MRKIAYLVVIMFAVAVACQNNVINQNNRMQREGGMASETERERMPLDL